METKKTGVHCFRQNRENPGHPLPHLHRRTAGFRDQASGQFQEVMLLRSDGDLEEFQRLYGVEASDIKREW